MARLTIFPTKSWIALPHIIELNGQVLGVMKKQVVHINLPAGNYRLTIRSMYKFIETSVTVTLPCENSHMQVEFGDHEKLWNILFNIDLVLWIVKRFVDFGTPWDFMYELVSNGFFVIWLVRLWLVRKRYFKFRISKLNLDAPEHH